MPLVAAAVCPHPPLLVPQVAAGAADETADLRAACDAAVAALLAARPDTVLVVGGASRTRALPAPYQGSFAAWGTDVAFTVGGDGGTRLADLSLLVGGWLLGRQQLHGTAARCLAVDRAARPADCARWGAEHTRDGRVALLAMGDGSACRGVKAPGYDDPRAEGYDAAVATALADADPDTLLALDPALSDELVVAGRASWQVMAGAARAAGGRWRGRVGYDAAPYGVGYLVATWTVA